MVKTDLRHRRNVAKLIPGKHLEELLDDLCRYGNPRISKMDNGWHAKIEMHVASEGATFNIMSEFNHKTSIEAVLVLMQRTQQTISDLNK
jgi:hypothetical protein